MNAKTNIERVREWCRRSLAGEIPCCLMVRKAIERWQADLERPDLYFDEKAFNRFVRFAREFKHYKGPAAGQRFEPEDWQLFIMANVIGLKRKETGLRKYTYADIYVPRKNGKTYLAAIFAAYFLLKDGEAGPEVYTAAISDICLSMKAEDYLDLPDLIPAGTDIVLTVEERKAYDAFEREQLLQVDEAEIEAVTAAALTNKLLQFTGGAVYDSEHDWHEVGRSKLEALAELVEMAGEPVLVFYAYQHELSRIQEALADYGPVVFKGEPDILERWNEGKIQVLLCHPASVAFGLNMQHGGRVIVWYTPTWNLELYQQANARLYRQGQERPVLLYHLVALGTMDERVMAALSGKSNMQEFVMQRIKELKAGASGASSAFGAVLERAKP